MEMLKTGQKREKKVRKKMQRTPCIEIKLGGVEETEGGGELISRAI